MGGGAKLRAKKKLLARGENAEPTVTGEKQRRPKRQQDIRAFVVTESHEAVSKSEQTGSKNSQSSSVTPEQVPIQSAWGSTGKKLNMKAPTQTKNNFPTISDSHNKSTAPIVVDKARQVPEEHVKSKWDDPNTDTNTNPEETVVVGDEVEFVGQFKEEYTPACEDITHNQTNRNQDNLSGNSRSRSNRSFDKSTSYYGEKKSEYRGRDDHQRKDSYDSFGRNAKNSPERKSRKHSQERKGEGNHSHSLERRSGKNNSHSKERKSGNNYSHSPGRNSGKNYSHSPGRKGDDKGMFNDPEYRKWETYKNRTDIQYERVNQQYGDLFDVPKEYALAHCVAEDMQMGAGIAIQFRNKFGGMYELLEQGQRTGGLATLFRKDRAIYYLVTKPRSQSKPTYTTLFSSLRKMRDHMVANGVSKVAMPEIGCGLDRLDWDYVKNMLEFLFHDETGIEILVCSFRGDETTASTTPKQYAKLARLVNVPNTLRDMENHCILLYFGTVDGTVTPEMTHLAEKFQFLQAYKVADRKLGTIVRTTAPNNYTVYGIIAQETVDSQFSFKAFYDCLSAINKANKEDLYGYIALQTFGGGGGDSLHFEKVVNMVRSYTQRVDVYVCEGMIESRGFIERKDFKGGM